MKFEYYYAANVEGGSIISNRLVIILHLQTQLFHEQSDSTPLIVRPGG